MESTPKMCFECLQRRIEVDFSGKLNFIRGLSDSPLPFGSRALVQVPGTGEIAPQQFVLHYVPYSKDVCLGRYVDEYCVLEDGDSSIIENMNLYTINQEHADVSVEIRNDKNSALDTASTECLHFSNGGRIGCETCKISTMFSCSRAITSLAPTARVGYASYELFVELALSFSSGSLEDQLLHSICLLIEGNSARREIINFLGLIGLPSFEENGFPGCIRHPNIVPILGMLKSSSQISIVLPKTPYTLKNILHYSPGALNSDWLVQLLIYQILSALSYMHGLGTSYGNLQPSSIMLTDTFWCWLEIGEKQLLKSKVNPSDVFHNSSTRGFCFDCCPSHSLYADLILTKKSEDWQSSFYNWWKGELSNFEYLLLLNRLAGRRWGDHTFYTIMPWVIDFSTEPDKDSNDGWRDLGKSKWRLTKGDEQLDFTYSTSEVPHHVSDDCLSELAVCSYKARRLPLSVLRTAVRSVYEPNEYPSNMQRLYQWTPDECIPEFYCDPRIFYSLHSGMPDLTVPSWAGTPEEFIKLHRDALESDRVSRQIHHWIDITFGYKMSGEAAIAAKNVMLPSSISTLPKSMGRCQLFTQPHPPRLIVARETCEKNCGYNESNDGQGKHLAIQATYLNELEDATFFCENSWHLAPSYSIDSSECLKDESNEKDILRKISDFFSSSYGRTSTIDSDYLLENIEVDDDSLGYQELLIWKQTSLSTTTSKGAADDIFSVGCILAELHLGKPLFGLSSLASYLESDILPSSMQNLPHHVKIVVEACIQKEWERRPSAKCLLESPYFSKSVKSSYLFLATFQLLAKDESRLYYAATFAKRGALKAMGALGVEVCATFCLPLVVTSVSDAEAEWAFLLLIEFLRCLTLESVVKLVVPSVQKILQATGYSHLKVSLLQGSFMQEIWNRIGKQAYLETIHPLIISNLCVSPHKSLTGAAAVLLIGSSEELGVPITVHQTILPLVLCFGKGLCNDGVDVLIRIGGLFGENFVVKQILPLLHKVINSCICTSHASKTEPMQSWGSLALIDCLTALDGLVPILTTYTIVKELIVDGNCPHVKILLHKDVGSLVLQNAAKSLIRVCQQIGPDSTALHLLPKLNELFFDLALSHKENSYSVNLVGKLMAPRNKVREEDCTGNHMDLALLLYPQLASLLGIEKLRQCCATWLLLEQFLLRRHNWKWEHAGDSNQSGVESINNRRHTYNKGATSEDIPAKLLLNRVGWSRPQLLDKKGSKNLLPSKNMVEYCQDSAERYVASSNLEIREPWYWFPNPATSWDGLDFNCRAGGSKDELQWKIRASIVQSFRAHHGALRSFAVCQNECTVFTAGVGPGFKGNIQKWELSGVDCVSCYNGHEEVVNDIFVLASSGRVASCDGTVHIWNGQTGKQISVFSESSLASAQLIERDDNMVHFNPLPSGMLSTAFHGNSYSTMDYLKFNDRLILGTGNGSLRFIDVEQGQKLHLCRSESTDSGFPSLISSICSSSSAKERLEETAVPSSWIAAGFSTGYCRLFDMRSGKIIASWQAHDGYVTKLAAATDHQLVSSSLDKTLRIWDLRRNWTAEHTVYKGYSDGVSGFSLWGQNVISICRNKIGLASLHASADEDQQYRTSPQHLYTADGESKNLSVLSAIGILPFSRLFLIGTEDGYLKICC